MVAITAPRNLNLLNALHDMMVDYRMRPLRSMVPCPVRVAVRMCLLHVPALQRADGHRPFIKPALLDVGQTPWQVA